MAIRRPLPTKEKFPVSKYHGVAMSEAEYLALPEEKPYLEYVDGVVVQKPMPDDLHGKLIWLFDHLFFVYAEAHGGNAGPERRTHLRRTGGYRLPDTAFWVAGTPSGKNALPTLVVEVRSEGQSLGELREKCRAFRANGVEACWLIDPYQRWVEVFDEARDGARLSSHEPLQASALPEFSIAQTQLFAVLDR
jgi:Uma2 family endonuclease